MGKEGYFVFRDDGSRHRYVSFHFENTSYEPLNQYKYFSIEELHNDIILIEIEASAAINNTVPNRFIFWH